MSGKGPLLSLSLHANVDRKGKKKAIVSLYNDTECQTEGLLTGEQDLPHLAVCAV